MMKVRLALKELFAAVYEVLRSLANLVWALIKVLGFILFSLWMLLPEILRIAILIGAILVAGHFAMQLSVLGPRYVVIPNCSLPVDVTDDEIKASWPDIYRWCDLLMKAQVVYGHRASLLAALIWVESKGNPVAISRSDAVGLMQVMPRDGKGATFICKYGPCFANRPTMAELMDPAFNIEVGSGILRDTYLDTGNYRDALKAYGPPAASYAEYADKVLLIEQRILATGIWPEN